MRSILRKKRTKRLSEALTPEQKVDMWHEGTRGRNTDSMSASSILRDYRYAKQQGYDDLCQQMADLVHDKIIIDLNVNNDVPEISAYHLATKPFTDQEAQRLYDEVYCDYYPQEAENNARKIVNKREQQRRAAEEQKRREADQKRRKSIEQIIAYYICAHGKLIVSGSRGSDSYETYWSDANKSITRNRAESLLHSINDNPNKLYAKETYFRGGYYSIDRYYGVNLESKTDYELVTGYGDSRVDEDCSVYYYSLQLTKANRNTIIERVKSELPDVSDQEIDAII